MSLTKERLTYKPFQYPWCYEAWLRQQQMHWLPEEVPMADDVRDWNRNLTQAEKNLITQILRFFTQADVEVNNCYHRNYLTVFKPVEVRMMLTAFSNMETIHQVAYSHLLDTVGMPEVEYEAFLKYKEMKDKHDYVQSFHTYRPFDTALTLAVFGGFIEGMQLFASFAMLLNFQRFNKMKGMGQIVAWSVRDETLHTHSIIRLYHEYLDEQRDNINIPALEKAIISEAKEMISHEDAFIDLAFEMGPIQGLTAAEVKAYIRYIAGRRLKQLGINHHFGVHTNPLPWLDEILNGVEYANFFESRPTDYSRGATQGTWEEVFVA